MDEVKDVETIKEKSAPPPVTKQRLRVTFTRDATLKYIGHLDMSLTWQRILRRAGLPLAYSEGFNPQPRITFAAALPVGCISDYEMMDVVLETTLDVNAAKSQLDRAVPPGIRIMSITEVPLHSAALQAQLQASEYEITLGATDAIEGAIDRVEAFVEASEVMRDRRGKVYNLRPLVQLLTIETEADRTVIRSRLQATESGTGRPDELLLALELDPAIAQIKRTQLVFLDKTI